MMDREGSSAPRKVMTTLSELLRSLYLHDLEYCLLKSPKEEDPPVFTKDQIISVLEKDTGEKCAWELTELCSFYSTLDDLLKKKVLSDCTEVLVIQKEGSGIQPVASLRVPGEETEENVPSWWNAPVPFVSWKKGVFAANEAAGKLLADAEVKRGRGGEFVRETDDGRYLLFTRIHPSVYFVEDVSEALGKAREMAWWAAVGKALAARLEEKGCTLERIKDTPLPSPKGTVEDLRCLWDGEELGFLRVNHDNKF